MRGTINATPYQKLMLRCKIDVGPSSYWSEIASMQSLDGLLGADRINIIQYLERMPNGIIPKMQELIEEKKQEEQMAQERAMMEAQAQQQMQQPMPTEQPPTAEEQMLMEQMARFVESLPPEAQQQLQQLPPDEMEEAVLDMMNGA
jgi:hypothetical protein